MNGGDSFQGTVSSATNVASQSGWFPYSAYTPRETDPAFTNQLNYLGLVYNSLKGLTGGAYNDAIGAVQLSIWYLIDKNFAVSGVGNDPHGNLLTDFGTSTTGILGLLNGNNETIEGLNLTGYSSSQAGTEPVGTLITVDRGLQPQFGAEHDHVGRKRECISNSRALNPGDRRAGCAGVPVLRLTAAQDFGHLSAPGRAPASD